MLQPIGKSVLFTFTDDVVAGQFVSKHNNGIITYRNYNDGLNNVRYAIVVAIGPTVESDITIGATIVIEPLQWTEGFLHDGMKLWRTTSDKVMALANT